MGKTEESGVPCSICLDLVNYDGERSWAKLQCGHEFHLDCIGSAFNMKGTMQCPNCRNIEKGRWSYASGSTNSSPELSVVDATSNDNYPFFFGFPEMPYRIPICPFRGLSQVPPSPESSVGIMSTITPMVNHQLPNGNRPNPHGWLQFRYAQFHHHLPLAPGMPRFIPTGRVYDPSGSFSLYGETTTMDYSHPWVIESIPYFPPQ